MSIEDSTIEKINDNINKKFLLINRIKKGGDWLAALRNWLQRNIRNGDTMNWNSGELVQIAFHEFETIGIKVAVEAIIEDRKMLLKYMEDKRINRDIINQINSFYTEIDKE